MKILKKIGAVCLAFALTATSAHAFYFPEPDWGALLEKRRQTVSETDFELYAESDSNSDVFYGAKFEPQKGTYIGMITENSESFAPVGDYLTYIDAGWEEDIYYPANKMIENGNSMVTIGWNFGSMYDIDYGRAARTLENLNKYNKPMFIRIAAEMNVSSLGDEPDQYIAAFRTLADMVHQYPNFAVVWSPNDLGALDRPYEYFYPGDEYVDWVGVSCYSIKYFQGNPNTDYKNSVYFMTGDYAWATNRVKPIIEFMQNAGINKPVMVSEGGVATYNSYGEDCSPWATPRFGNMLWYLAMKYPQIKLINYFNTPRPDEVEKFDITNYGYAADIFRSAAASGAYIRTAGGSSDFVFKPAEQAGTLVAKDNAVKLYTLAYIPDNPYITVNYSIDGVWKGSGDQIPYVFYMDLSGIADGVHTLKIETTGASKEYTFTKSGSAVAFGEGIANIAAPEVQEMIQVNFNDTYLNFDQPPIIQNGRTLVPLRTIFEAMGASVDWNEATQTVTAVRGSDSVSLTIGSNVMMKNGSAVSLDVPAQIVNSRTLVPARAIAEAFGAFVGWDEPTRTVVINM